MARRQNPVQAYLEHMSSLTVRVVGNAATFETNGSIGSGVLLQRPAGIVLLTAGHNFDRPGTWTIESSVQARGKTVTLPIPTPQRLLEIDLETGKGRGLDIAWSWLDLEAYRRTLQGLGLKGQKAEFTLYRGPIDAEPVADSTYGFAAYSRVQLDANLSQLDVAPAFEIGMEYRGTDEHGLHEFALARPHQGREYYNGASGAPIADETGRIVSILV
ncbi:MAG TPA: hypothetical protein VF111_07715, partial [Thermoanaerobaculia bacterium]